MQFFVNNIPEGSKKASGIYLIKNEVNGKVYVGKALKLQRRYNDYKAAFKREDKRKINPYLMNALSKHGPGNFSFSVLEICCIDQLAERELFWMQNHDAINPLRGYNLRLDSSTGMVTHPLTRQKISERVNREFAEGIRSREAMSALAKGLWADEQKKAQMARSLSLARSSVFIQKHKNGEPVAVWTNINQILDANPDYKWQNIYAACNGNKPTYRGFQWERVESVPEELKHLEVNTDFVFTNRNIRKEKTSE